jgi:hypothetical protein
MSNAEVAARLRAPAQEARTLQQHLRRLLQPGMLPGPATRHRLAKAIQQLEALARKAEALATLAETQ